jgi:hypothetical protein
MHIRTLPIAAVICLLFSGCGGSPTEPGPSYAEFVVSVEGETFVLRTVDAETRRIAEENLQGKNRLFPAGPVIAGDGGFNSPWSWHLDPVRTRFVEVAIEVCDGRPSDVENDRAAYTQYCPWGARVVAVRTPAR